MIRTLTLHSTNPILNGLIINDFTYTAARMGDAVLTASIMNDICLDDYWDIPNDYVEINGERFFIRQIPSSSKSNTDLRYKHELKFSSNREVLKEAYAILPYGINAVVSLSVNVQGYPSAYADKLNTILESYGLDYRIVYDSDRCDFNPARERDNYKNSLVTLEESTLWDALQQFKDVWDVDYFFGERLEGGILPIYLGNTTTLVKDASDNEITFQYGDGKSFLNVQKANSGERAIRSITGHGGSTNIPYYYPNPTPRGCLQCWLYDKYGTRYMKVPLTDQLLFSKFLGEKDYLIYRTANDASGQINIKKINGTTVDEESVNVAVSARNTLKHNYISGEITYPKTALLTFRPQVAVDGAGWSSMDLSPIVKDERYDNNSVSGILVTPKDNPIPSNYQVISTNDIVSGRYNGKVYNRYSPSLSYLALRGFFEFRNNKWYIPDNKLEDYTTNASIIFGKNLGITHIEGCDVPFYCGNSYIFKNKSIADLPTEQTVRQTWIQKRVASSADSYPKVKEDFRYIIFDNGQYYAVTIITQSIDDGHYSDNMSSYYRLYAYLYRVAPIPASIIPIEHRKLIEINPAMMDSATIFDFNYNNVSNHFIRNLLIPLSDGTTATVPHVYQHVLDRWIPYEGLAAFATDTNSVSFLAEANVVYQVSILYGIVNRDCTMSYKLGNYTTPFEGTGWYKNRWQKITDISRYGIGTISTALQHGTVLRPGVRWYIQPSENLMPTIYRASGGYDRWYKALRREVIYPTPPGTTLYDMVTMDNPNGIVYQFERFMQKERYYPSAFSALGLIEGGQRINYNRLELPYRVESVYNEETEVSDYYLQFENEYGRNNPSQKILNREDIFPTIKDTVVNGRNIGRIVAVAYDELDDDSKYEKDDSTLEYRHPYFFVKLAPMGFNLFQHAIDSGNMTLEFQDGLCAGCKFEIGVSDDGFNLVQVDGNNNLIRFTESEVGVNSITRPGDVKRSGSASGARQDTTSQEVWIALKKDIETYGVVMPNREQKLLVNGEAENGVGNGDEFIIVNIALPERYIEEAERRLDEALVNDLNENNSEKFVFSGNTSRIYCERTGLNPAADVLNALNENSLIKFKYANRMYEGDKRLKVTSYTYKSSPNSALPEINITMEDKVTVYRSPFKKQQQQLSSSVNKVVSFVRELTAAPSSIQKAATPSASTIGSASTSQNGALKPIGGSGGTSDHTKLSNRDVSEQHPMSAISGLQATIENITNNIEESHKWKEI